MYRTLLLAVISLTLVAQPIDGQTTFDACYVPEVGALYLIGLPGLPTECLSSNHQPVSWSDGTSGIEAGSVGTNELADAAVTTAKLAEASVATSKIGPAAITTATLADEAVGTAKLGNAAVTAAKIAADAVTSAAIADGSVGQADLGSLSVGSPQLQDGAVTSAKIGADVVLPPDTCAMDEVIRWDGTAWVCATATGLTGRETVTASYVRTRVDSNVYSETFTATCPAGKQVLGGGYELVDEVGRVFAPIKVSRPEADTAWAVTLEWQLDFPGESFDLTVYAICATPG